MAKHEVRLEIEMPVGKKDTIFTVMADKRTLGRLRASQGGVDWLPAKHSKRYFHLTWEQVAKVFREQGREY